jgi:hypothetical protein
MPKDAKNLLGIWQSSLLALSGLHTKEWEKQWGVADSLDRLLNVLPAVWPAIKDGVSILKRFGLLRRRREFWSQQVGHFECAFHAECSLVLRLVSFS